MGTCVSVVYVKMIFIKIFYIQVFFSLFYFYIGSFLVKTKSIFRAMSWMELFETMVNGLSILDLMSSGASS